MGEGEKIKGKEEGGLTIKIFRGGKKGKERKKRKGGEEKEGNDSPTQAFTLSA